MKRQMLPKHLASKYHKTIISWYVLMLAAIIGTLSRSCVEGLVDETNLGPKPKGTLKTIKVLEDGDVIDCVDINKQPAFDNPLIKELKTVPSSLLAAASNNTRYSESQPRSIQTWNKYGECPDGTIPIRRTLNNGTIHRKANDERSLREYATVFHRLNKGNGGRAVFNVWNPRIGGHNEFSLSQMWVTAGPYWRQNNIEAGWTVYPHLFKDSRTRLFIFWTNNDYKSGCYNLLCPAFVQTSKKIVLGGAWEPVSEYNKEQIAQTISFSKAQDIDGGDWWLQVGEYVVGYYHRTLFPDLGKGADFVAFGGEIVNTRPRNRHTTTTMGSGYFSTHGLRGACFISNIQVANEPYTWVEPRLQIQTVTKPTCYDLMFGPLGTNMGSHFYFGGPGLSSHCP